jgi:hypothetical protein
MKTRIVILSAALALVGGLSGCGEDLDGGLDAGTAYAISSGTFNVTNAVAVGEDQCGILSAYQPDENGTPDQIDITDNGGIFSFNLSQKEAPAQNEIPTAVLDGNTFDSPVASNYTVDFTDNGSDCVVRVHQSITGNLVADNTAGLTLTFDVAAEPGTTCSPADTNDTFAQLPCASQYTFTATLAQ